MALDPSLVASKSEPTIPRSDHHPHTAYPDSQSPPILPISSSNIATPQSAASHLDSTMQEDITITQLAESLTLDSNGGSANDSDGSSAGAAPTLDVDPQILEALRSKDRIYVLKLGETFEALIMERRLRVELNPSTSYQRLLVHRCSAYYKLVPESDPVTKGISVVVTSDTRIPDRRISELVPAESTAQPAFKIMRRSVLERRAKPQSHAGSVAGEDEFSDPEQSESGSMGGHSSATNSSNKKRMTIEEREAAYKEARTRIFMDFEEKEKEKDKDMSASSSTLSLNGSASTSTGGRSSGDTDDAASSPATESEWSAPSGSNSRDKKDGRRGGPPSASTSSSRSLRNGGSFQGNSSGGSSRNSRAPSPSFSYASLHDSPMAQIYDPSQHHPNPGYFPNHYAYPYSPPAQGPAPFLAPYPYYPQHYGSYQSPPPVPQHNPADPTTPPGAEPYSPAHQINYMPHYGWPHPQQPPLQSPSHTMQMSLPPQPPQQNMGPPQSLPPHSAQYQPFAHPGHTYPYTMNGYYPPPPPNGQMAPPPPPHMNMQQSSQQQQLPQHQQHPQSQPQQHQQPQHQQHHQHQHQPQQHASEYMPRVGMNGSQMGHMSNGHFNNNNNHNTNGPRNLGNGVIPPNHGARTTPVRPGLANNGFGGVNGNKQRGPPMAASARSAWSYGPGLGPGPFSTPMASSAGDAVGPRLSNMTRRTSGNSSSGGNSRASSNCDDVSSTSSSTNSSSSRRTFTSTTSSSQHPLPPRPDWAVGLKAQPTLAGARHHDIALANSRTMSPISPPRSSNGHNSPMGTDGNASPRHPSVSLQAQDFPPLTAGSVAPEKRPPAATGAWGSSRPILSPTNGNINAPGNAGSVHHSPIAKQEENDRGLIERPSPKSGEVFNPKLVRRPPPASAGAVVNGNGNGASNGNGIGNGHGHQRATGDRSKEAVKDDVGTASLTAQVSAMSLGVENGNGVLESSSPNGDESASVVAPAPSSM